MKYLLNSTNLKNLQYSLSICYFIITLNGSVSIRKKQTSSRHSGGPGGVPGYWAERTAASCHGKPAWYDIDIYCDEKVILLKGCI